MTFILYLCAFLFSWSVMMNVFRYFGGRPTVPATLMRMADRISKGNIPTHVNLILQAKVSGYDEHYRRVPGRLSCNVRPIKRNGENIYALVIGFKETAAQPAESYITIPVYKNGNLYEH